MTKKNWKEMSFEEFWGEVKRRGVSEIVEDPTFGLLQILHKKDSRMTRLTK